MVTLRSENGSKTYWADACDTKITRINELYYSTKKIITTLERKHAQDCRAKTLKSESNQNGLKPCSKPVDRSSLQLWLRKDWIPVIWNAEKSGKCIKGIALIGKHLNYTCWVETAVHGCILAFSCLTNNDRVLIFCFQSVFHKPVGINLLL